MIRSSVSCYLILSSGDDDVDGDNNYDNNSRLKDDMKAQ